MRYTTPEPDKLLIKTQIIDNYFGNVTMAFSFPGDRIGVEMRKCAEDFLDEHSGFAGGRAEM